MTPLDSTSFPRSRVPVVPFVTVHAGGPFPPSLPLAPPDPAVPPPKPAEPPEPPKPVEPPVAPTPPPLEVGEPLLDELHALATTVDAMIETIHAPWAAL